MLEKVTVVLVGKAEAINFIVIANSYP